MELASLHTQVRNCTSCELSKTRQQAVPGEGPADAAIMFIGEAPGKREDETGAPFVGAAGRLLNRLLAQAGIDRDEVFITSILKCRPPGNRNPRPEEIAACSEHLQAQITAINPRVICPLGNFALKALVGSEYSITESRGKPLLRHGRIYLPMFHPAAALYNRSLRETMEADMRLLKRFADEMSI